LIKTILEIRKIERWIAAPFTPMNAVGIDCGKCRFPLRNLTEKEYAELITELDRAGFFELKSQVI